MHFLATEGRRVQIIEDHIRGMLTYEEVRGREPSETKYSMRGLGEQILRLPKDRTLVTEEVLLVREFLYRLETARCFLHNIELIPDF